jgi:hypothetical protein
MNNLLPYYGLGDARISASEKDLPVFMGVFKSLFTCDGSYIFIYLLI